MRQAGHITKWVCVGCIISAVLRANETAPPRWESTLATTLLGTTVLKDRSKSVQGGDAKGVSASVIGRSAVPIADCYLLSGVQTELFRFSGAGQTPGQLTDLAAPVGIEFRHEGETAAHAILRPGWYFARSAVGSSWDIPFEIITGVPLTHSVNGVIGISDGRFYHRPLPIIGLATSLTPRVKLQMVFPEPALVFSPNANNSWRVRGELNGGGFRGDSRKAQSVVEFASYQAGAEYRRISSDGSELSVSAGIELIRRFDYFRDGQLKSGGGSPFIKVEARFAGHPGPK